MSTPAKLTPGQIEERRLEGGRLLRAGRLTHSEIAQRLGVSLRDVQHWAKQLRDHPSSGLRASEPPQGLRGSSPLFAFLAGCVVAP